MGLVCGGGQFGQNGQKLHEDYKINIFGEKQWEAWGQANFSVSWGRDPPSFPTRRNLRIKGTMSLRVLLPHSLSHLVGYENEISRKEIDSVDLTSLS